MKLIEIAKRIRKLFETRLPAPAITKEGQDVIRSVSCYIIKVSQDRADRIMELWYEGPLRKPLYDTFAVEKVYNCAVRSLVVIEPSGKVIVFLAGDNRPVIDEVAGFFRRQNGMENDQVAVKVA